MDKINLSINPIKGPLKSSQRRNENLAPNSIKIRDSIPEPAIRKPRIDKIVVFLIAQR